MQYNTLSASVTKFIHVTIVLSKNSFYIETNLYFPKYFDMRKRSSCKKVLVNHEKIY